LGWFDRRSLNGARLGRFDRRSLYGTWLSWFDRCWLNRGWLSRFDGRRRPIGCGAGFDRRRLSGPRLGRPNWCGRLDAGRAGFAWAARVPSAILSARLEIGHCVPRVWFRHESETVKDSRGSKAPDKVVRNDWWAGWGGDIQSLRSISRGLSLETSASFAISTAPDVEVSQETRRAAAVHSAARRTPGHPPRACVPYAGCQVPVAATASARLESPDDPNTRWWPLSPW
jgi:hypothetical protein